MHQEIKNLCEGILVCIDVILFLIMIHMRGGESLVMLSLWLCALSVTLVILVLLFDDAFWRHIENDHYRYNQAHYLHTRYV